MKKIVFLVLNYKNMAETIKCVGSIRDIGLSDYDIVLVDNGSNDFSVQKMNELYGSDKRIHIVASEENVGFSKGNNLGYTYIKQNLAPDFVVVTNNDVLFPQKDFEERLIKSYEKFGFYVLGPDIFIRANKEHQSPMMLKLPTQSQLEKELKMYEYYQRHPQKWVRRRFFQGLKNRLCQSIKCLSLLYSAVKGKEKIDPLCVYENCCVQGACIIISKDFLRMENKMFSPEPFLYCEELFLYKKCIENNYKIVYDPTIQIWHEDSSTMKIVTKNALEKARFTLQHHVTARRMLVDFWCKK